MLRTIRLVRRCGLAATAFALVIALVPTLAPSSARADSVNGQWLPMTHDISPPFNTATPRSGSSIVYDSVHDRLVMTCGQPSPGGPPNFLGFDDAWTLDLTTPGAVWVQVPTTPTLLLQRYYHMSVYDPVNDRVIMFGGYVRQSDWFNDVWQLKASGTPGWTQLFPSGTPPLGRENAAVVYDPVGQRMIVFGGATQCQPVCNGWHWLNDTWSLSLSGPLQWTQLSPSGTPPSPREVRAFAYNPDHGSMIVYDGDTWELSLAGSGTWTQISASNPPPGRQYPVAGYDPAGKRFLIFGGYNGNYLSDLWQLPLDGPAQWTQLSPTGPGPSGRELAASCFDPVRNRLAVFAGYNGSFLSDVRFLSLSGPPVWSYPFSTAPGPIPPRRENASVIWPEKRQMFTFGGTGPASDVTDNNETWTLDVTSPNNPWFQIAKTGAAPSARHGHRAVWDPLRQRMLVFGGYDGSFKNDLWGLSPLPIPNWVSLGTTGTPPVGRMDFGLAYDPVRDQLIVVGGNGGSPSYLNDAWALPLSGDNALTWSALAPSGTPPDPRWIYGMQYDVAGDRMIFFGGQTAAGSVNDVWALNLSGSPSWTPVSPAGTPPTARTGHTMVYDPRNNRMIMFGGYDGFCRDDAWALQLGGSPAWSLLAPLHAQPSRRELVSAVFDVAGNQMLLMGGWDCNQSVGNQLLADTWALAWDLPAAGVPNLPPDLRFALEGASPNPASGDHLNIAFSLPRPERARLDVLDLAGRRVASRDVGAGAAGRQVITVTAPRALHPGVYLVKLSASEGARTAKVSVMR